MKTYVRAVTLVLTVLLLAATVCPTVAFADDSTKITKSNAINDAYYFWGAQMNTYSFSYYDGSSITMEQGGFALHYAGEDLTEIVGSPIAYCIEPNAGSTNGTTYSGTAAENSAYWNNKLSPDQREAIQLILLYGAPNALHSRNAKTLFGYEGATQILIWEIVMGLRSPLPPYTLNDSRMKDNFYGNQTFPSTKTAYDSILEKMRSHLTVPSFASVIKNQAPTYELTYDASSGLYQGTLKDVNKVLSKDYEFAAKGVSFTKDGNTLRISAPASAFSEGDIVASAAGESLDPASLTQMIWTLSKKQTVTTFSASPDPVICYFKLHAAAELNIVKTSTDGKVKGISFKVEQKNGSSWKNLGTFQTNKNGKITVPDLQVDDLLRVTEVVPDGYICTSENPQTVTLKAGTNKLNFKNAPTGGMSIYKYTTLDPNAGDPDAAHPSQYAQPGYLFKIENTDTGKVWYAKTVRNRAALTNSSGQFLDANGNVTINSEEYVYTIKEMTDGHYKFTELISKMSGAEKRVFPSSWQVVVTNSSGEEKSNVTYGNSLEKLSNGDCLLDLSGKKLTGLTGGGSIKMIIKNKPFDEDLLIKKTSTNGKVSGISFKVDRETASGSWSNVGTYTTNSKGEITVEALKVGTKYRITELVPENYVCTSENPQIITIRQNTSDSSKVNTVSFENTPMGTMNGFKYDYLDHDKSQKGYVFKIENLDNKQVWYGVVAGAHQLVLANSSGQPIQADGSLAASSDDYVYTFKGLVDGHYRFTELISKSTGADQNVFPHNWTLEVTAADGAVKSTNFRASLVEDDNGDCVLTPKDPITGLTGGGKLSMYIYNEPEPGNMSLYKYTTDDPNAGNISASHAGYSQVGYRFRIKNTDTGDVWYGEVVNNRICVTEEDGTRILNSSGNPVYIFNGLTDGHYEFTELISKSTGADKNVFPSSWRLTITDKDGAETYNREFTGSSLVKQSNGDCKLTPAAALTGLNGGSSLTMVIQNKPITGTMRVYKYSSEDPNAGDASASHTGYSQAGYRFKFENLDTGKVFYGKTVVNGIALTNENGQFLNAGGGLKTDSDAYVYTFKDMRDGHYRITELISASTEAATQAVFPSKWVISTEDAAGNVTTKTYKASLIREDNGDCTLNTTISGVSGGGKVTMTITNAEIPGNMSIFKYSALGTDVPQSGYRFRIKNADTGDVWYGKVATNRLYLTEEDGTPVRNSSGGYVYKFTGLKDGTYEITELLSVSENADRNVKPTAWNITVVDSEGTTTYSREFGSSVQREFNGDYSVTASNVTGISGGGTMTMTIQNTPLPRTVTVWKTSTDGKVKGISFRVEKKNGSKWEAVGTYTTDAAGKLDIPAQEIGTVLRITETVPDNYICLSDNPQQITVAQDESQNTVSFENTPMGNMRAYKYTTDDPNAGDISASHAGYSQKGYLFKFENLDTGATFYGKAVVNRLALANASGQFLNKDGGIKTDSDAYVYTFPGMLDGHYRFTELISLSDDNVNRDVKPTRWEILVEDHDGETRHDLVFGKSITAEDNGGSYFISPTTRLTGLTGGGTLTMIVSNKTTKKPVAVQKSSADGKIDGIEFVVRDSANQVVFRGLTDADGILNTPKLTIGEAYSFEEIVPEGYVCTSDNPQTITLSAGVNRVLFSNEPVPSGSISIRKVNEKNRALSKIVFLLEYSQDAGKTWKPVKHRNNNEPVKIGYCTSDGLKNGKLATNGSGFASFTGLSLDAELRYRLTEISTKPGYSLLSEPAFEGPITGTEPEIELTVVNMPFFQIPLTGGRGFAMTSLVVFAVGSAALALLLVLKKRRGLGV